MHNKIVSLGPKIIAVAKEAIVSNLGKDGNLDNYKIVWNQLERLVCPKIKVFLESIFKNGKIILAKSKSAYPDILIEIDDFKFAIDLKSNESSKDPWYDIARLDTIEERRLNVYDEEYELVIKYDSNTGKLVDIFFATLRETVGIRLECNGVKYRIYDGKIRPKSWDDFSNGKIYWKTKEQFLEGINRSKKCRLKEIMKEHAKSLNISEKKEYIELFK